MKTLYTFLLFIFLLTTAQAQETEATVGSEGASEITFTLSGNTTSDGMSVKEGANTLFRVRGDGNVGIGTATPTSLLDLVGGNLDLDNSTSTIGNITKNGTRFLHNFGTKNTFLGANAGNFTTTGTGNTATGEFALRFNSTGDGNTAVGQLALKANNTGAGNSAFGVSALSTNQGGISNTAIGASALLNNVTGSQNVAVGSLAGNNATTGSNNIYLGANVVGIAGESNTMYLGLQGTQTRTFIAGIRGITTGAADGITVLIDSDGQLGTVSSSKKYKKDISDMADATNGLMKLRPVLFTYKSDNSGTIQYGLIAEEVAEIYPELVVHTADGRIETIRYHLLSSMLLNEVQKQHKKLEYQIAEITNLNDALEEQEKINEQLKENLSALNTRLDNIDAMLLASSPQHKKKLAKLDVIKTN